MSVLSELLVRRRAGHSLRHSHAEETCERHFPGHTAELEQLASTRGLAIKSVTQREDQYGRNHVSWETVVLVPAETFMLYNPRHFAMFHASCQPRSLK